MHQSDTAVVEWMPDWLRSDFSTDSLMKLDINLSCFTTSNASTAEITAVVCVRFEGFIFPIFAQFLEANLQLTPSESGRGPGTYM